MVDEVGSHAGLPSMRPFVFVMSVWPPPFGSETTISRSAGTPLSLSNAMCAPSGDQAGRSSFEPADCVMLSGFVALTGCVRSSTKMSYLFPAETPRAYAILVRSGDHVGWR